jgi:DNA-binding IclR family transcriptional regulator
MKKYGAPSVKKAFAILSAISSSKEGLGVSEIARGLDIAKSTVHGMASALEEVGAVIRDPATKKYRLGFMLFQIGRLAYSQIDLKTSARPIMEDLMAKTETSVFLGTLNWDHVTVMDIVESRQDLKITAPIGTTMPLFAGAVGKVFLASMETEQSSKIIENKGLPRYTENSIVDKEMYYRELQRVKEQGYAIDNEEYILGVRAVAAPIMGLGQLRSAIWMVGFKASLDETKLKPHIQHTQKAAADITKRIQDQLLAK